MKIKHQFWLLFIIVIFFNCKNLNNESELLDINIREKSINDNTPNKSVNWDSILSIRNTITDLDLSDQNLVSIPNLSSLKIYNLDLSNNNLDSLNTSYLPSTLIELNLSKNNLIYFKHKHKQHNLEYLNLSFNNIENVFMWQIPRSYLDLSNNELKYFSFIRTYGFNPTLDVSNNEEFDNLVNFSPKVFDTILRENIKNNKPFITVKIESDDKGYIVDWV